MWPVILLHILIFFLLYDLKSGDYTINQDTEIFLLSNPAEFFTVVAGTSR